MEKEEIKGVWASWRRYVFAVVFLVVLFFVWYVFYSYEVCSDEACFEANLRKCDRAKFIGGGDMIFRYSIRGEDDGSCSVDVELLQGELNNADSRKLEGSEMTCSLPIGVVDSPESDISLCHGLLKEGLQDLVIRKLHTYLIQNLGRLNLELTALPEVASVSSNSTE